MTEEDIRFAEETADIAAASSRVQILYTAGLASIDDVKVVLARAKAHLKRLEERLHEQSTSGLQGS